MTLLNSASSAQCKSFLPELLAGKGTFALALTESGAGSDAAAISTRAERVCDGWSITGRKVWISGARDALRLVVAARSQTGSRGRSGVTLFLVPPESAGLTMTILSKVGNRCSLSYDIGFDKVTVPFEAIVGEEGRGFEELQRTLFFARSGLSAAAIGTAQAAVDTAANHAKERIQFNQPIGSFQALAHRLAKMQTEVDKSRLLAYRLASGIDNGEDCTRLASQAKWSTTETLKYVTEEGMQIMASAGYSTESPMQRYWRDARLYTFGEGSSELQLDLIAYNMGLGRALKR
jgi:alkylation response protein AidB-like acyl-CoA dehydrogenase